MFDSFSLTMLLSDISGEISHFRISLSFGPILSSVASGWLAYFWLKRQYFHPPSTHITRTSHKNYSPLQFFKSLHTYQPLGWLSSALGCHHRLFMLHLCLTIATICFEMKQAGRCSARWKNYLRTIRPQVDGASRNRADHPPFIEKMLHRWVTMDADFKMSYKSLHLKSDSSCYPKTNNWRAIETSFWPLVVSIRFLSNRPNSSENKISSPWFRIIKGCFIPSQYRWTLRDEHLEDYIRTKPVNVFPPLIGPLTARVPTLGGFPPVTELHR